MIKLARTLVLPLAVLAALTACDKGKSGGGGGGATGAAGAAAIAPANGGLKRALAAMPKDTDAIFGVDLAQVRGSSLFKKYEPMIKDKIGKQLDEFKSKCGFDPMEKVTGILAGAKGEQFSQMTIFIRGFDKSAVVDCIKKAAADPSAQAEGKTATIDGDYVEMSRAGRDPIRFMFVDDKTILMLRDGESMGDKAALAAAAGAKDGEGLTGSPGFTKLLDGVKTGSTVWFVMNGNSAVFAQMPLKLKAVLGWITVSSGVDGEMRLRMSSKDEATTLVTMANAQMDQVKGTPYADFVKHVKLSASGEDAVVNFKLDDKQFDTIVTQMTSLAGGGGF